MNRFYNTVKQQYETTKPIRGRSEDIRPAGKRRRDWERVTNPAADTYAYRLYNTDCVIHEPHRITLTHGKWPTTTTAKFINTYTPFSCGKRYNNLWVYFDTARMRVKNAGWYPIYKQLFIDFDEHDVMVPRIEPVPVRTVNRKRAKELRGRLDKFLTYGMTMLKLSDGWVTAAFRHEAYTYAAERLGAGAVSMRPALTVQEMTEPTDELMPFYMMKVLFTCTNMGSRHGADGRIDHRFDPSSFKRAAYRMHDNQESGVYNIIHRMPDGALFDNIVPEND